VITALGAGDEGVYFVGIHRRYLYYTRTTRNFPWAVPGATTVGRGTELLK